MIEAVAENQQDLSILHLADHNSRSLELTIGNEEGLDVLLGQTPNLKLAILQGSYQQHEVDKLMEQQVPAVIHLSEDDRQNSGVNFLLLFYETLFAGKKLDEAFYHALRETSHSDSSKTEETPPSVRITYYDKTAGDWQLTEAPTKEQEPHPLYIRLRNWDNITNAENQLKEVLKDHPQIQLMFSDGKKFSDGEKSPDFDLNIVYKRLILSYPDDPFRPAIASISLNRPDAYNTLVNLLQEIHKYEYVRTLESLNPQECPVKLEIEVDGSPMNWEKGEARIELQGRTEYRRPIRFRLVNNSKETVFASLLYLSADFGISSQPFQKKAISFKPGESRYAFDGEKLDLQIEEKVRLFNHPEDLAYLKVMASPNEFDPVILDQDELPKANEAEAYFMEKKGLTLRPDDLRERLERQTQDHWWAETYRLCVPNPHHNTIAGDELPSLLSSELGPLYGGIYLNLEAGLGLNKEIQVQWPTERDDQNLYELDMVRQWTSAVFNAHNRYISQELGSDRKALRLLAIGDVWLHAPQPEFNDAVDLLLEQIPVFRAGAPLTGLESYLDEVEVQNAVKEFQINRVLTSFDGGRFWGKGFSDYLGQDKISKKAGTEIATSSLMKWARDQEGGRDLNLDFFTALEEETQKLEKRIAMLEDMGKRLGERLQIILHAYDYLPLERENTLYLTMRENYVKTPEATLRLIVDCLNEETRRIADQFKNAHYADLRGNLILEDWHNEWQPNQQGYHKIADALFKTITNLG